MNVLSINKDKWKCITEIVSCMLELCEVIAKSSCCTIMYYKNLCAIQDITSVMIRTECILHQ